jgi:hypothetical protein
VERELYVRTIGEVLASMPASRAPVPSVEAMPQGGGQTR